MIDFSVAVHSYNRKDYIVETIESVLKQTLKPKEIIVIDDGSSDETELILKPYNDLVFYEKIANVGCGTSRKIAVEKCKYDWIACNDDDDLWEPNHLEELAKVITAFPSAEYLFSNHSQFDDRAEHNYDHFLTAPDEWWDRVVNERNGDAILLNKDAYKDFLNFNPSFPSTWAFTKKVYEKTGGIDTKYSRMNSEDSDFTRRVLLNTVGACTSLRTVKLRRHGNNMSDDIAKNLLGKAIILEDILHKDILPLDYIQATKNAISAAELNCFRHYYWRGDYLTALNVANNRDLKLTSLDYIRKLKAQFRLKFQGE
jgi:glycosyltransferase involved in cell wall biosynthesis